VQVLFKYPTLAAKCKSFTLEFTPLLKKTVSEAIGKVKENYDAMMAESAALAQEPDHEFEKNRIEDVYVLASLFFWKRLGQNYLNSQNPHADGL
jgi:hypothetical protein